MSRISAIVPGEKRLHPREVEILRRIIDDLSDGKWKLDISVRAIAKEFDATVPIVRALYLRAQDAIRLAIGDKNDVRARAYMVLNGIQVRAIETDRLDTAIKSVAEAAKLYDLGATQYNVIVDPAWIQIRNDIMEELSRFPEAKAAVIARLRARQEGAVEIEVEPVLLEEGVH